MRQVCLPLAFALALSACSGGGSGDGRAARVSASTTSVVVNASTSDYSIAPATVAISVANPPDSIFAGISSTTNAVNYAEVTGDSPTRGTATVHFRDPASYAPGNYSDVVSVELCYDEYCNRQLEGSPINIAVTLNVTDSGGATWVNVDRTYVNVTGQTTEPAPVETLGVSFQNPPESGLYTRVEYGASAIASADYASSSNAAGQISIHFKEPGELSESSYYDQLVFSACFDPACDQHVNGSPVAVSVYYQLSGPPAPDRELLSVSSELGLAHDIVDAEYSSALDAIVMVAAYPDSRLYVYDIGTATEASVTLNKVPTSVSVGPDGLTAAVGHDAMITIVDLPTVGQAGSPAPTVLDVSTRVFDVVLAGNGYVHAFPETDQWVQIHSVQIATNTEYLSAWSIYEKTRAKLHPSGTSAYGTTLSDIEKYDLSGGPAAYLYDSPYHGDYEMCGNLWISESGVHIYTACGNVFRSSTAQAQDMVYNGALELSSSDYWSYRVGSLSQSAEAQEILLAEHAAACDVFDPSDEGCRHHVNFYESTYLQRTGSYSLPFKTVVSHQYQQVPLFVFHSADGTRKYLLVRLQAMPNPNAEYYLYELQ